MVADWAGGRALAVGASDHLPACSRSASQGTYGFNQHAADRTPWPHCPTRTTAHRQQHRCHVRRARGARVLVCMCVCVCTYVYVCMCVFLCVWMCAPVLVCVLMCMCMCMCTRTCVRVYLCMCVCARMCVCPFPSKHVFCTTDWACACACSCM